MGLSFHLYLPTVVIPTEFVIPLHCTMSCCCSCSGFTDGMLIKSSSPIRQSMDSDDSPAVKYSRSRSVELMRQFYETKCRLRGITPTPRKLSLSDTVKVTAPPDEIRRELSSIP